MPHNHVSPHRGSLFPFRAITSLAAIALVSASARFRALAQVLFVLRAAVVGVLLLVVHGVSPFTTADGRPQNSLHTELKMFLSTKIGYLCRS